MRKRFCLGEGDIPLPVWQDVDSKTTSLMPRSCMICGCMLQSHGSTSLCLQLVLDRGICDLFKILKQVCSIH